MKFAAFEINGAQSWGIISDRGFVRGASLCQGRFPTLQSVIEQAGTDQIAAELDSASAEPIPTDLQWRCPVGPHSKVICVGLNYGEHAAEAGREALRVAPSIFIRLPHAQVAHLDDLVMPLESTEFDFEGELAVVIGKSGSRIARERAYEHVFGYTCLNDGSVRDYQKHSVMAGKNFPSSGAIGPWILSAASLGNAPEFQITTVVSGEVMQSDSTRSMIFPVPDLIEYISTIIPLSAGDVISTGTPAGVGLGRKPPRWLQPGDVVEITISNIGTLRNKVSRR